MKFLFSSGDELHFTIETLFNDCISCYVYSDTFLYEFVLHSSNV